MRVRVRVRVYICKSSKSDHCNYLSSGSHEVCSMGVCEERPPRRERVVLELAVELGEFTLQDVELVEPAQHLPMSVFRGLCTNGMRLRFRKQMMESETMF